jgi:hypothetical protein
MGGNDARIEEKRNAYGLSVGKPKRKRPLRWPRRWRVHSIKIDFGETGWGGMGRIGLAQDRNK